MDFWIKKTFWNAKIILKQIKVSAGLFISLFRCLQSSKFKRHMILYKKLCLFYSMVITETCGCALLIYSAYQVFFSVGGSSGLMVLERLTSSETAWKNML